MSQVEVSAAGCNAIQSNGRVMQTIINSKTNTTPTRIVDHFEDGFFPENPEIITEFTKRKYLST